MKSKLFFSALTLITLVSACGPAAEDREQMHIRAKIFQDSIANIIRTSMAEAEGTNPNATMVVPQADTTQAKQAQ